MNQDWIAHEVDANPARRGALVEVHGYGFRDLPLQIAKVLTLRGDAAAVWVVPAGNKPARFVPLDLKGDLFH